MRVARLIAAIVSVAAFSAPLTAFAQRAPASAPAPSYARPSNLHGQETIKGRVRSFNGTYALQIADERGFTDNVELHRGTIINPTGLRLESGMSVTIIGYNRGRTFAANQIDTPYQSYGFEPAYPVYYPYPVYPVYSIGVGFGTEFHHHWH